MAAVLIGSCALGCTSDHHVSPYADVDIAAIMRASRDLDGQIARAGRETTSAGLHESLRVEGALGGGDKFVALGYEGTDAVGRLRHAVRVATPSGVVLALGPVDIRDLDPSVPDTLLASLLDGGGFPSGFDLTGDGEPDIATRAPDGTLAVYRIETLSATRYPVRLLFTPLRVDDVNGDGRADLLGTAPVDDDDAVNPVLIDAAICDGTSFRNDHADARTYHARERDRRVVAKGTTVAEKAKLAVERAFHDGLSGTEPTTALRKVDDAIAALAPLPDRLSTSWVKWRGRLVDLMQRR